MFRRVSLYIIRSSFTVHSAMVYVIHVCRQLLSRIRMERNSFRAGSGRNLRSIPILLEICLQTCTTYTIAECTGDDDGQRNFPKHVEFHAKNKFGKLVHLVGFITKKQITIRHKTAQHKRKWWNSSNAATAITVTVPWKGTWTRNTAAELTQISRHSASACPRDKNWKRF